MMLIKNASVVGPEKVDLHDVRIEDDIIAELGPALEARDGEKIIDASGKYLLPGFVDVHNHGAMGFDATFGSYESDKDEFNSDPQSFALKLETALGFYQSHGVTKTLLTTMASPTAQILTALGLIDASSSRLPQEIQKTLAGINIEGTFLKMPAYAGAQNPEFFADADLDLFDRLNQASGQRIKMLNVPPEHGATGLELISHARDQGIAVAGGHTGSSFDEFSTAVEKGLSLAVHFFNGPSRSSSKPFGGGGAEEAMLYLDDVSLELILDGYHVSPPYVRDAMARKGFDRIVGITDSMFVNGLSEVDSFRLAGLKGMVSGDQKYLHQPGRQDALFGSVLTMDRGYANLLGWLTHEMTGFWYRQHEALTLDQALVAASKMCSLNPAAQIDLAQNTGSIQVDKSADLILAEVIQTSKEFDLKIDRVFCEGMECTQTSAA